MNKIDGSYRLLFSNPQLVRDLCKGMLNEPALGEFDWYALQPLPSDYTSNEWNVTNVLSGDRRGWVIPRFTKRRPSAGGHTFGDQRHDRRPFTILDASVESRRLESGFKRRKAGGVGGGEARR